MSGSGSPLLGSPTTARHRSRSPMSEDTIDLENARDTRTESPGRPYGEDIPRRTAQKPRWRRCRLPFSYPGTGRRDQSSDGPPRRGKSKWTRNCSCFQRWSCLCQSSRKARWVIFCSVFLIFGIMQLPSFILGAVLSPWNFDWVARHFEKGQPPAEIFPHWPTNYTGGVKPLTCHSHNDYWRDVPLFSALQAGCISVEADVWMFGDELYIAHDPSSLAFHRTLRTLYIQPLFEILDNRNQQAPQPGEPEVLNGVFDTAPSQTLVLLVDVKARGRKTWTVLQSQLSPLREKGYLTHFNGTSVVERPITVVATGRTPYELLVANSSYRDIFFDAPLNRLSGFKTQGAGTSNYDNDPIYDIEEYLQAYLSERANTDEELPGDSDMVHHAAIEKYAPYGSTNSYYASVSFNKAVGYPFGFHISSKQRRLIRDQVREAHERGLKARYWSTPGWPRFLRNHVWNVLLEEGVDVLNVDDLRSPREKESIWMSQSPENSV